MANTLRAAGVRPADYQAFILPVLMFKVVCDRNDGERDAVIAEHGEEFWNEMGEDLVPFTIPAGCTFAEQQRVAQNLGESLRDALIAVEKHNSELAGVFLDTDYAALNDKAVRELYDVLSQVSFSPTQTSQDALGQAYEYLLGKFADAAGAKAGQFFTPHSVAELLVRIVDPQPGDSAYDPTCGSGGLLNAIAEHVHAAGHDRQQVALFGQELDAQSHAIATVNMFLHGNAGEIRRGDTLADPKFTNDDSLQRHSISIANPPFGLANTVADVWSSDRFGRFRWGSVVRKPSELAFVAHIASSLKGVEPSDEKTGRAAIVLPMGALFRKGAEGRMRKNLLEAGLVDAVIALPGNLFYNTSIPASVLVLRTDNRRSDDVLFVDASAAFKKVKKQAVLEQEHLDAIEKAYITGDEVAGVRTKTVPVADLTAADADLTVTRWLPAADEVEIDVPAALEALRQAERASTAAASAFWARIKEAGYAKA